MSDLSRAFGAVAEAYEEWRPTYPAAAVDWIADRTRGGETADIGAGTGKAAAPFVQRRFRVTAVEPDPKMAEVGRRSVPEAAWVVASAEDWEPQSRFDLIFGGQSWHWVSEAADGRLAGFLDEGGVMAWFWNHPDLGPEEELLGDLYERYMPGNQGSRDSARHRRDLSYWLKRMGVLFSTVEPLELGWSRRLTADSYLRLIGTYSDHIALEDSNRIPLVGGIRERIDSVGGIDLRYTTRVVLGSGPPRV